MQSLCCPHRQGPPTFLLVLSCDVAGAVEVPPLTPGVGDTLYSSAAVCPRAEFPESLTLTLTLTFLTAKWDAVAGRREDPGVARDGEGAVPSHALHGPQGWNSFSCTAALHESRLIAELERFSHLQTLSYKVQEWGQPPGAVYSQLEGAGREQS